MAIRGQWLGVIALVAAQQAVALDDSALADAAMQADGARVRQLLKQGANPNVRGAFGTPPLHWLEQVDDVEGAALLLKAGADAKATTERGISALSLAIANGNAAMVHLLLEAGADASQLEPTGETQLMMAAQVGVPAIVKDLLQHGAAVDTRESAFGQTALMYAARGGHAEVVAMLLDHGADARARTRVGNPPRFIAPNSVPGFGFGVGILRGGVPADRGRREPAPGGMITPRSRKCSSMPAPR